MYEIGRFIERNIDDVFKCVTNCDTYFEELLDDLLHYSGTEAIAKAINNDRFVFDGDIVLYEYSAKQARKRDN